MKLGPIIAITVAAGVTAGLYFANRTPSEEKLADSREAEESREMRDQAAELDQKVAEAVEIIQAGEQPPMVAIGMLREVLEANPNHIGALMWLGEFSLMSGQLDKAEERYLQVLSIDQSSALALKKLIGVYLATEREDAAVEAIQDFLNKNQNHSERQEIETLLSNIRE